MALLQFTSMLLSSFSSSTSSSPTSAVPSPHPHDCSTGNIFGRLSSNHFTSYPKPYIGCRIQTPLHLKEKSALLAKASAEGASSDAPEPPSENEKEDVPVQDLPLESKLQQKLEQKMRMKLAKKIRLRRKRLVRKRHLRKKGRWPPSKLKKNKNV